MSVEHSASELKNWAESLRDRVSRVSGRKKSTKEAGFNAELKVDLLDAIDLLLEHADDTPEEEAAPNWVQEIPSLLSDHFQQWQTALAESLQRQISEPLQPLQEGFTSELSTELRQQLEGGLTGALSHQLSEVISNLQENSQGDRDALKTDLETSLSSTIQSAVSSLVDQLEQGLFEKVSRSVTAELATLQPALEQLQSQSPDAHELSVSIATELSELIKQSLDSTGSDDSETLAAVQKLAHQQEQLNEQLLHYEDLLSQLKQDTNAALSATTDKGLQDLVRESKEQSASQNESFQALTNALREHGLVDPAFVKELEEELESTRNAKDELTAEKEALTSTLSELTDALESKSGDFRDLESKFDQLRDENEKLHQDLQSSENELGKFRKEVEQAEELFEANESLEREIKRLQDELENSPAASENDSAIEELLSVAKREIEDLRNQNSDLAAQVAKQQVLQSNSAAQAQCDEENLTWEDRKRLIMQQFMEEDEDQASAARIEIEQVIATSDRELAKRDQRIADLEQRIDSNEDAVDVSQQLIDQDEVIQQERERLTAIQQEWEEKLRQAEIDLSMERAKLARERMELESAKAEKELEEKPDKGRTRKWLDHLGLREEKKPQDEE